MSGYEKLDSKWIDEHEKGVFMDGKGRKKNFVWVDDLQNLLVPEQEKVDEGRVRLTVGFDGGTESYYATDIGDALGFLTDYDTRFTVSKEPIIPEFVAEWIVECKEIGFTIQQIFYQVHTEYKQNIMSPISEWINENEGLFAESYIHGYEVEKQKYYVVKSEGLDGVHYYFTKFDDEMNGLFTRPNDKKGAYRFDDKEKAQAIANYTDSKVEELE